MPQNATLREDPNLEPREPELDLPGPRGGHPGGVSRPSLTHDFLVYDDQAYVTEKPACEVGRDLGRG
jgi:hypothetical protein